MVTKGNYALGGEHNIEYTDIKLYCTPEIYIMSLANVTSFNFFKKAIKMIL